MRVDLTPSRPTGHATASASLLAEWRIGAIVEATAIRDVRGQLWLRIGSATYPARIASGPAEGPQNGEVLQARVLRTHPVLALETLASHASEKAADVIARALRLYVPRQSTPAPLLANLAFIARGQDGENLPAAVTRAAAQLWQAIPHAEHLGNPVQLERALMKSGVFLESNLAQSEAPMGDLKALLLELQRVLSTAGARANAAQPGIHESAAPPSAHGPLSNLPATSASLALLDHTADQMNELARQTEGTLARLTTTQIQNAAQTSPMSALAVEIPVRIEDRATLLRLRIERDDSRNRRQAESNWSVETALDLGILGGLHARVSLTGQRVAVQIRAESPHMVEQISARAPELVSLLRESGLIIDRIVCLHGMPAADTARPMHRLLDLLA